MVVLLIVLVVVAVLVAAIVAPSTARPRPKPIAPIDAIEPAAYDDPIALANSDPVEALLRYGTPETADQLRAQGVDLAALGYREGGEA